MKSKTEYVIRRIEERGIKLSPTVRKIIEEVLHEAEESLGAVGSVSASPDTLHVDREVIEEVVRRPGLLKLLLILYEGPRYTRELLGLLNMWEDGQRLIKIAANLGLIVRKWGLCYASERSRRRCLWNYITDKGTKVLKELGYI